MVSSSSEGSASKISIVRRRSVTRMGACGSWASDRGQASMLHEQQRNQTSGSTGHFETISIRTRDRQVNRGPATWWTVLALALINLGVASTIVSLTATFIFP